MVASVFQTRKTFLVYGSWLQNSPTPSPSGPSLLQDVLAVCSLVAQVEVVYSARSLAMQSFAAVLGSARFLAGIQTFSAL